ncbi:MAG: hypothetical protein ACJ72V_19295, partial [Nitrososphaeraceae archaeon]
NQKLKHNILANQNSSCPEGRMDLARLNNSIRSSQYSIATTRRKYITTVSEIRILLSVSVELIL